MALENKPWNLESFVDALVLELDKTRETLAVKSLNKPLSYSVKDMALDLHIFPTFDGEEVRFTTARPGEEGASKVTIKLDSITEQVVRATSKKLPGKNETSIEQVEELDEPTKKSLRKMGVRSLEDLEKIEESNVDIEKIKPDKINYTNLADIIQQSRRKKQPPKVNRVSLSREAGRPVIVIEGTNLAVQQNFLPVVVVNDRPADVLAFSPNRLRVDVSGQNLDRDNRLVVALDPYSIFKLNLKND